MTQIEEWWSAALADLSFVMDDSVNWMEIEKWFDIYMNVWKMTKNCSIQENVSRVTTYFMQLTSKRISFCEKNHALLIRERISFMLKQTFFDSMHVYIAWSAVSSIQNKYYHISELLVVRMILWIVLKSFLFCIGKYHYISYA